MEKYTKEGQRLEVEYSKYGSPIYDAEIDSDDSREDEETEYDEEGYPVGRWIPTLVDPKSTEQLIQEEKVQRKVTLYVILGCLAIIAMCFGLALFIVKP